MPTPRSKRPALRSDKVATSSAILTGSCRGNSIRLVPTRICRLPVKIEAAAIGEHVLYHINEYIKWGAFGPPEETPLFEDPMSAIENGLYELWDADTAVTELSKLLANYPNIRDIHFWAQFPGESVESGNRRLQYIADAVLPRLRP